MSTSSVACELNHECVSTRTSTHVLLSALIHGYICFISILTRLYLLHFSNYRFVKRMLTGWRLVGCSFYFPLW